MMRPLAAFCLTALAGVSTAQAERLDIARMYAAPDLSGPRLQSPKFSPDGRCVTFLRGKQEDKNQLDLWAADTRTGATKLLIDSNVLEPKPQALSPEEAARRERQRTSALHGIVEYDFSPDGRKLLIPLGGDLYIYDLSKKSDPVSRLTQTPAYETDARFSPRGRYVSFIRDQNIVAIELATGREIALTTDGHGLVQNGVAEFVAQEEMDRDTGYWWSPDESKVAYTQIDDSPVEEVERVEIEATGAKVVKQRYPAAGTPNARVTIKVVNVQTLDRRDLPLAGESDVYVARVDWLPNSRELAVQRESRDQRKLDLIKLNTSDGTSAPLLTETSPSWIELNDDLYFLKTRPEFIWGSGRSGFHHLYLYGTDGHLIRPLTEGNWVVTGDGFKTDSLAVDELHRKVYFVANEKTPLEQHVYSTSLDTTDATHVTRISTEEGVHNARFAGNGSTYLDTWSSPDTPPNSSLRDSKGAVTHWLLRNALDDLHPFHPYVGDRVPEEYGSLKASDGQDLYYRLTKPAQMEPGRRYPVVVDVYGGPGVQTVRREWMSGGTGTGGYFRQILAQHGFVVFAIDNRGSKYRGGKFASVIKGQLGKFEVEDQVRGIEWLKQQPFVDGNRIGVTGWSYGGYMSLMCLSTAPAVFKVAIAGAPVTNWRLYDTHYTERYLDRPQTNSAGYDASGVLAHIEGIRGKLLLVHGMADDNVLFANSTELMKALQDRGVQFDLMTYPGAKHALARAPATGKHFYELSLEFLERELKK